jgi:protein O-GlcNAc transferase
VLDAWGRLLAAVPRSRLIVLADSTPWVQNHLQGTLARHGVDATRLEICNRRSPREFLTLITRADIALDPFPFNGHTTTCDSLWMGVPVIMMAGQSYASRFGSSALVNLGLEDLIASSTKEYVEIARSLAGDPTRLAQLRNDLRTRMTGSPLLDATGFTRNLENAFREMWVRWCSS